MQYCSLRIQSIKDFLSLSYVRRSDMLVNLSVCLFVCLFVLTGSGSAPTLVPPVLRGLTELFLVVENLAQVRLQFSSEKNKTRMDEMITTL